MADKVKMVRLQNVNTGAIVEVREEKVDRLGSDWEPASAPKASAKSTTAKAKSDD